MGTLGHLWGHGDMGTPMGTRGHLDTHGDAYGDIQRDIGTPMGTWGRGDTHRDMGTWGQRRVTAPQDPRGDMETRDSGAERDGVYCPQGDAAVTRR